MNTLVNISGLQGINIPGVPGSSLIGAEKTRFDELKAIIDRATNDILIRPDWSINMECVDTMNRINGDGVYVQSFPTIPFFFISLTIPLTFFFVFLLSFIQIQFFLRFTQQTNGNGRLSSS